MKIVPSVCCHDCGGACPLNIYVEDGRIVKIEPRDVGLPAFRPCARGLLYHYRVYAPDRLKYPLKRTGERGEGKFTRISWDEALSIVAGQITRIRDTYGPAAIFNLTWSGPDGRLHHAPLTRLLNMAGGHSRWWGGASNQGGLFATLSTYGELRTGNERADLLNANLIILWGCNPAENIFGTETRYYLTRAKEKGIKIICVDPRYTDTAATWAAQWIPIRPGTDAAMLVAMAYVILNHQWHNQDFLDKFTTGFTKYQDYLTGVEDGIAKTPQWAEKITGVPAETIEILARDYATAKPAVIMPGYAPGRSARGEQYHRAATALSAMTGNIGIHGGATACLDRSAAPLPIRQTKAPVNYSDMFGDLPIPPNPVDKDAPPHEYAVKGIRSHTIDKVNHTRLWDAILKGKSGGYYSDYKMLYIAGGNGLNQLPDTNKGVAALKTLEFMVVQEHFMTPTAKFADILLPSCTWCERNDIRFPWGFGHYAVYANKAIEPLYESKSDLDIMVMLAEKMGIAGYNDKAEDEWLRLIAAKYGIPDYEAFKANGFYKLKTAEPFVAFQPQIQDPEHNPFPTPSGKIEIFCQRIADFNRPDVLPAIPKYIPAWEGINDPMREQYPLQFINPHSRKRVHSQLDNVPWFKNLEPHTVWINPVDASQRSIKDGERVKVFNDRGTVNIPAKVTNLIMPGVVCIYEGTWYNPDALGVDRGGCVNVLTRGEHSPGGAYCSNTVLVQVAK